MFEGIKNTIATRISPSREHLGALHKDLRSRLGSFTANRSAKQQNLLEDNFHIVLLAWGIEDAAHIHEIVQVLRLRFVVFLLPIVLCCAAVLVAQSVFACLSSALIALPCVFGILTTRWRMVVLAKQHFIPFGRWLGSIFLFQKGF